MERNVPQIELFRVARIAEADVLKIHAAVPDGLIRGSVRDVRLLVKDLVDAPHGRLRTREGHNEPRKHRQRRDRLRAVGHDAHKLAREQARRLENDLASAEKQQKNGTCPHNAHLDRAGQREQARRGKLRVPPSR